jgi:hypothetical protein
VLESHVPFVERLVRRRASAQKRENDTAHECRSGSRSGEILRQGRLNGAKP